MLGGRRLDVGRDPRRCIAVGQLVFCRSS